MIFPVPDYQYRPDPVFEYNHCLENVPLVIDNGSYQCRVGWATESTSQLFFKNLIAKTRGKKDIETQVGNDISNIEVLRWLLKSPFDKNVVTQLDIQEIILDHIFTHMGLNAANSIDHPIVMTEAVATPNACRQMMSELLFECYQVPSVAYGVDAIFSLQHNERINNRCRANNALVINCSYHFTHLLPVLDNKLDLHNAARFSIGGIHMTSYLHRLLQLKYPFHFSAITISRLEELLKSHTYYSKDFEEELKSWMDEDYYNANVHSIQLPYTSVPGGKALGKMERCQAMLKNLREMHLKRRSQKLAADEEKLNQLNTIQELFEDGEFDIFQRAMHEFGFTNIEELQMEIEELGQQIQRTRALIIPGDGGLAMYSIHNWDELDITRYADPETWIQAVRNKLEKCQENLIQQKNSADRSIAEIMKESDDVEVVEDDIDGFEEQERIRELEEIIQKYEDDFLRPHEPGSDSGITFNLAEYYQLRLGIERMRVPEMLFRPEIIGIEQMGLMESIEKLLHQYNFDQQDKLVQNVFLTGGCAAIPGLQERLMSELRQIRPFQSTFCINVADNPVLDGWQGAREWARSSQRRIYSISKQEYEEMGGDYLKEHHASNRFFKLQPPAVSQKAAIAP